MADVDLGAEDANAAAASAASDEADRRVAAPVSGTGAEGLSSTVRGAEPAASRTGARSPRGSPGAEPRRSASGATSESPGPAEASAAERSSVPLCGRAGSGSASASTAMTRTRSASVARGGVDGSSTMSDARQLRAMASSPPPPVWVSSTPRVRTPITRMRLTNAASSPAGVLPCRATATTAAPPAYSSARRLVDRAGATMMTRSCRCETSETRTGTSRSISRADIPCGVAKISRCGACSPRRSARSAVVDPVTAPRRSRTTTSRPTLTPASMNEVSCAESVRSCSSTAKTKARRLRPPRAMRLPSVTIIASGTAPARRGTMPTTGRPDARRTSPIVLRRRRVVVR